MTYTTRRLRLTRWTTVLLALFVASCGSGGTFNAASGALGEHQSAVTVAVTAFVDNQAHLVEAARLATDDFTDEAAVMDADTLRQADAALAAWMRGHGPVALAWADAIAAASSAGVQEALTGEALESTQKFVCGGLCVGGAALIGGYLVNRTLHSIADGATDRRTSPMADKLANTATEAELAIAAVELGLASTASRAEVVEAFGALEQWERLDANSRIQAAWISASADEPDVREIDAEEENAAFRDSLSYTGSEGLKLGVGTVNGAAASAAVAVAPLVGISDGVATLVDVTLSATGYQPLDLIAGRMNVVVASEETRTLVVPIAESQPVSLTASIDAFRTTLASSVSTPADHEAALDAIAVAAAREADADPNLAVTEDAYSVTIEAPARVTVAHIDPAHQGDTFDLQSIGAGFGIVTGDQMVPETFAGFTPEIGATLGITGAPVAEYIAPGTDPADAGGGGGGTSSGMRIEPQTPGPWDVGDNVPLFVYCPDDLAFPITVDMPSFSGGSFAWSTPSECPFVVLFSADTANTWDITVTITDDTGRTESASISLTTVSNAPTCDTSARDACADAHFNSTSACHEACPERTDPPTRESSACNWGCDAERYMERRQCDFDNGCVPEGDWHETQMCNARCHWDFVACVEAIDPDQPPEYFGACNAEHGQCLGGCF